MVMDLNFMGFIPEMELLPTHLRSSTRPRAPLGQAWLDGLCLIGKIDHAAIE
jgi:hypothetical protein